MTPGVQRPQATGTPAACSGSGRGSQRGSASSPVKAASPQASVSVCEKWAHYQLSSLTKRKRLGCSGSTPLQKPLEKTGVSFGFSSKKTKKTRSVNHAQKCLSGLTGRRLWTGRGKANWPGSGRCVSVNQHVCTDAKMHERCQNPRVSGGRVAHSSSPELGAAFSAAAQYPCLPARAPPPSSLRPAHLPSPSPARPPAQSIVGHKQSAPKQAGVSRAATAAAPSRTRAAAAPSQPPPPLPSLPFPFPTPTRQENASRRRAPQTACPRPTAPNGRSRGSRGPLAPPLRPSALFPPAASRPPPRRHAAARGRHAPAAGRPRA